MKRREEFHSLFPHISPAAKEKCRRMFPPVADGLFALFLFFFPDCASRWIFLLAAAGLFFFFPLPGKRAFVLFSEIALILFPPVIALFTRFFLPSFGMALWIGIFLRDFFRPLRGRKRGPAERAVVALAAAVSLFFLWRSAGTALPDLTLLYAMSFAALFCFRISRFVS